MAKHPGGAPRKYKAEEIAKDLQEYIDKEIEAGNEPMIEKFCFPRDRPSKETVYRQAKECEELANAIKRCSQAQEIYTVEGAQNGSINSTFAIFKLKQKRFGWRDKQEIEQTTVDATQDLTKEERRARISELKSKLGE